MALFHRMSPEARRLRDFPTFSKFSDAELQKLATSAQQSSLPAHWPLVHERTPGDACYILLSGSVAVFVGNERVAELGPGEVIGEAALRNQKLRSATVSSIEPVELLRIDQQTFDRLLGEIPALGAAIDATVARHMGETSVEQ